MGSLGAADTVWTALQELQLKMKYALSQDEQDFWDKAFLVALT